METLNALLTRRSIRKYKDQKISEEKINEILKAAMYAPSAFNLQPWDFIVVDDKQVMNDLIKIVTHAEMIKEASHTIIVCGDNEKEKSIDFIIENCSAAVQNILLAAHDLGIGTCWIALYPLMDAVEGVKKYFNLPGTIIPIAMVSLGYPDEAPAADERFIRDKIHFNKW